MRERSGATLRDYKARLLRVLVHIQEHLDEVLRLEPLAKLACFSPFHFHRVFRYMVGESLRRHIRRLRLERAAVQLKLGRRPVTRIALDGGYGTHEAFTRAFKAHYGVSPAAFRRRRGVRALETVPSGLHWRPGRPPRSFRPPRGTTGVEVKALPPRRVAFARHTGPYRGVGRAWDLLLPRLGKDGWIGGDARFIGVCHDDPDLTPASRLRYDACVTVDAGFVPSDEIGVQVLAGGDYAVSCHEGPYDTLGDAYARLFGRWLPRSGREPRPAPCLEVYLNDPGSHDPAELLTDVHVPLEPERRE